MVESVCKWKVNLEVIYHTRGAVASETESVISFALSLTNRITFALSPTGQLGRLTKQVALIFQHTSQPGFQGSQLEILSENLTQIQLVSIGMKILNIRWQQIRQPRDGKGSPKLSLFQFFSLYLRLPADQGALSHLTSCLSSRLYF